MSSNTLNKTLVSLGEIRTLPFRILGHALLWIWYGFLPNHQANNTKTHYTASSNPMQKRREDPPLAKQYFRHFPFIFPFLPHYRNSSCFWCSFKIESSPLSLSDQKRDIANTLSPETRNFFSPAAFKSNLQPYSIVCFLFHKDTSLGSVYVRITVHNLHGHKSFIHSIFIY